MEKNIIYPNKNIKTFAFVKPLIKNHNIIVGDYTYFVDEPIADNFEKHVTHHYDFYGDKLIIGKYCAIGKGVEFVMNGCNHQMNASTTYPFYICGFNQEVPTLSNMPLKGDTIIGNDVWIGENVKIMPGVKIGDGAIIGANSLVSKDVEPYTIVGGNPIRVIKKRFDDEFIKLMQELAWWDKTKDEVEKLIPILTNPNIEEVKEILKKL